MQGGEGLQAPKLLEGFLVKVLVVLFFVTSRRVHFFSRRVRHVQRGRFPVDSGPSY